MKTVYIVVRRRYQSLKSDSFLTSTLNGHEYVVAKECDNYEEAEQELNDMIELLEMVEYGCECLCNLVDRSDRKTYIVYNGDIDEIEFVDMFISKELRY